MVRIAIVAGTSTDVTPYVTRCVWSGSRTQIARKLEFEIVQSEVDKNIEAIRLNVGYTIYFFDDEGELQFKGNVYEMERNPGANSVQVIAYDNLKVLTTSKSTEKFKDQLPEDIARSICGKMGVYIGKIAATKTPVSFIANAKTGYEIICGAYAEAAKSTNKKYQLIMNGDNLNVIERGELCGVVADSSTNMTDSIYKKSIENLINAVQIVDENGNFKSWVSDAESVQNYSQYMTVYKEEKDKDAAKEARSLFTKPEQSGSITMLGDYRLKTGYSLLVTDSNFNGRFWIKSDSHDFSGGIHVTKMELEFENIADKMEVEKAKGAEK